MAVVDVPGRNAPCWCGSGRKYKKCCWAEDQQAKRNVVANANREYDRYEATACRGTEVDHDDGSLTCTLGDGCSGGHHVSGVSCSLTDYECAVCV